MVPDIATSMRRSRFAFTQMSGIGWYGDLGNLLVMPTVGDLRTNSGKEGA